MAITEKPRVPFKDHGVYLITGGLGARHHFCEGDLSAGTAGQGCFDRALSMERRKTKTAG